MNGSPTRSRPFHPALLALFFLLQTAVAAAPAQDLETVEEFRKYFKKYEEQAQRIEAVLALEGVEHPAVVDALVPVLKDEDPLVVDACVRVLGGFDERPPVDHLLAELEKEKNESIRVGILRALAAGGYGEVGEAVTVCLTDRSWDVRRRAVLALAATGDQEHVAVLLPLCADKEVAVRCAALDGLAELHADAVRGPAVAALADESWQVRSSAIGALGKVRHRDSIEPLIQRMRVEEGRLLADIAASLEELTGRGFGHRVELWERFWETYRDRYEIPTDAELATLRASQEARKAEYSPQGQVAYHGIETPSRRVLFVIDVSGSMENEVVEKERFEEGGYPSFSRMDIVKTELARTLENLEAYVEFNVLAFATDVDRWKKKLVSANVLNKSSALDWVARLEPLGGASKEDLARVGLVGAANLEAGKTNTFGALSAALELDSGGSRGPDYEVSVDTVFFLSDGKPTTGLHVDHDAILDEIRAANELRKVVIHTIALGQFDKTFMKRLAQENGGVFVDLGQ